MRTVYIAEQEVDDLIAKKGLPEFMRTAMSAVESGLIDFSQGKIQHERRVGFLFNGNTVEAMPARRVGELIAFKVVNFHRQPAGNGLPSVMSITVCLDEATGRPVAVIESTRLTAIRTGLISGIAINHLFPEAKTIGLIGAGVAGGASLRAGCIAAKPDVIYVHDIEDKALDRLNESLKDFSCLIVQVADPEKLVRQSDVIITGTYGDKVVVEKDWIARDKKKLIVAVGSDVPGKSEVAPELYADATVIVDFKEQAIVEGDTEIPINQGVITPDSIAGEMHEILSGKAVDQKPLTIFDSTGDPVSDLIMAELILKNR